MITREQITEIYDEVDRRVELAVMEWLDNGENVHTSDVTDYTNAVLQGVYGTLMKLTGKDWPDVVRWIDDEEAKRNLSQKYEYKVEMKVDGKWQYAYYPYGHSFMSPLKSFKEAEDVAEKVKAGWRDFASLPKSWEDYKKNALHVVDPDNVETRIISRKISVWTPIG